MPKTALQLKLSSKHFRPPNLFGTYDRMDVLTALALHGPRRRRDFVTALGTYSVDTLDASDKAALMVRWRLPNGSRGWGLALNPAFLLLDEVCALLQALGRGYPPTYRSTCTKEERVIPKSALRSGDMELLFTSRIRTRTLITMELLGALRQNDLTRCVPGHSPNSVMIVLRFLQRQNVIKREIHSVRFSPGTVAPATPSIAAITCQVLSRTIGKHILKGDETRPARTPQDRSPNNPIWNLFARTLVSCARPTTSRI